MNRRNFFKTVSMMLAGILFISKKEEMLARIELFVPDVDMGDWKRYEPQRIF